MSPTFFLVFGKGVFKDCRSTLAYLKCNPIGMIRSDGRAEAPARVVRRLQTYSQNALVKIRKRAVFQLFLWISKQHLEELQPLERRRVHANTREKMCVEVRQARWAARPFSMTSVTRRKATIPELVPPSLNRSRYPTRSLSRL